MKELNYIIPISISESFNNQDFFIQGIAINATTTDNNHKFLPQELRKAAASLNGRPLLSDHDDSLRSVIGKVVLSEFDEIGNSIKFKAKINDTEQGKLAKQLIQGGDLSTVSIGANIDRFEEEGEVMIPIGIKFKELSLVATPADDDAQFTLIQSLNKIASEAHGENDLDKIMRKLVNGEKLLDEEITRINLIADSAKGKIDDVAIKKLFKKINSGEQLTTDDESILSFIIDAARKRKTSANSTTITSGSFSFSSEDDKLNNRRLKIMEKDETSTESEEESKTEEPKEETKEVDEMQKDISTLKSTISDVLEQQKSQTNLLSEALAELKKVKESDVDEEPKEEPKAEEPKEETKEEPKEKTKETEETEEAEEEEESEDSVDENYKIVQRYQSFTVEKNKYR